MTEIALRSSEMEHAVNNADLRREMASLSERLGDMRMRYRHRQTPFAATQQLIEVDREIRDALSRPLSSELQVEVRRLAARLIALDPH
jgi:hypothetical protein